MASDLKTAAAAQPKVLISTTLGTSETALYLVPAATSVVLKNASLCNVSAGAVTVNVDLCESGGTIGDATHRIVSGYSLAAHDTLPLSELLGGHVMGPGDSLSADASAPGDVCFVVSGVVFA